MPHNHCTMLLLPNKHGIHKQFITRYTPQQNGVAKRKNKTIMEMAMSMLKEKHLPNDYWAEAISCARYILNRCPIESVQNIVPEEAWTGRKKKCHSHESFWMCGLCTCPG